MNDSVRIGLIADTHGTLPAAAVRALAGVTRILHAGDVGSARIIDELTHVAPVTAVRGNTDRETNLARWALPAYSVTDVAGVRFALTHIKGRAITLEEARRMGCDVYVFGHTHAPEVGEDDGMLVVNPGSPSRARGGHGHSVGIVEVGGGAVLRVELLALD